VPANRRLARPARR